MTEKKYRIKDLPEDQRPREKLLKYGAEKLTDAELLAILLRTGREGKNVLELARQVLTKYPKKRLLKIILLTKLFEFAKMGLVLSKKVMFEI